MYVCMYIYIYIYIWEADFPDWRSVPRDARFTVRMGPDDVDQPLRYELLEDWPTEWHVIQT